MSRPPSPTISGSWLRRARPRVAARPDGRRINLRFEHDPAGMVEKAGEKAGVVDKRMEGDLERFKQFIEQRGVEEGGWRGRL